MIVRWLGGSGSDLEFWRRTADPRREPWRTRRSAKSSSPWPPHSSRTETCRKSCSSWANRTVWAHFLKIQIHYTSWRFLGHFLVFDFSGEANGAHLDTGTEEGHDADSEVIEAAEEPVTPLVDVRLRTLHPATQLSLWTWFWPNFNTMLTALEVHWIRSFSIFCESSFSAYLWFCQKVPLRTGEWRLFPLGTSSSVSGTENSQTGFKLSPSDKHSKRQTLVCLTMSVTLWQASYCTKCREGNNR